MSISEFVWNVLKVPTNLVGFSYTCKAIQYVVEHDGDSSFYTHLQKEIGKSYACIEKAVRLAKSQALKNMSKEDYYKIYSHTSVKTKEFICSAAQYYRKEYLNEDKEL